MIHDDGTLQSPSSHILPHTTPNAIQSGQTASKNVTKSFEAMHASAVALHRQGDLMEAASAYSDAIQTLHPKTHPRLHITLCNRAMVYNTLGLHTQALEDAREARLLTSEALRRCVVDDNGERVVSTCAVPFHAYIITPHSNQTRALQSHLRTFVAEGRALLSMGVHDEAYAVFQQGLSMQPSHLELKQGLQDAALTLQQRCLDNRIATSQQRGDGMGMAQMHALVKPTTTHHMLKPLRAHHVRHDPALKDPYVYLTIKNDTQLPFIHMQHMQGPSTAAWVAAVQSAVQCVQSAGRQPRVLHLGAGAGMCGLCADMFISICFISEDFHQYMVSPTLYTMAHA